MIPLLFMWRTAFISVLHKIQYYTKTDHMNPMFTRVLSTIQIDFKKIKLFPTFNDTRSNDLMSFLTL